MSNQLQHSRHQYWSDMINEHLSSGLSKAEFCRRKGIAPSAFYSWSKIIAAEPHPEASHGKFIAVKEKSKSIRQNRDISLSLKLPTGAELIAAGFDIEMLKELFRGLL